MDEENLPRDIEAREEDVTEPQDSFFVRKVKAMPAQAWRTWSAAFGALVGAIAGVVLFLLPEGSEEYNAYRLIAAAAIVMFVPRLVEHAVDRDTRHLRVGMLIAFCATLLISVIWMLVSGVPLTN